MLCVCPTCLRTNQLSLSYHQSLFHISYLRLGLNKFLCWIFDGFPLTIISISYVSPLFQCLKTLSRLFLDPLSQFFNLITKVLVLFTILLDLHLIFRIYMSDLIVEVHFQVPDLILPLPQSLSNLDQLHFPLFKKLRLSIIFSLKFSPTLYPVFFILTF